MSKELRKRETTMDKELILRQKCPKCGQWYSAVVNKSAWRRFKDRPILFSEEFLEKEKAERIRKYGKVFGHIDHGVSELFYDIFEIGVGVYNAAGKVCTCALCGVCGEELVFVKPSLEPETYSLFQQEIERARLYSQVQQFDTKSIDDLILLSKFSFYDKDDQAFKKAFGNVYEQFLTDFLKIAPYQRRYIMLVRYPIECLPDSCLLLPYNRIPNGIEFYENRLPIDNCLYVLHPYHPDLYIPFDEFDIALFKDEMTEFLDLMSKLGAKKIEYERCSEDEVHEQEQEHLKEVYSGQEKKRKKSVAQGTMEINEDPFYREYQNVKDSYLSKKEFRIGNIYPYVPEGLSWLNHRKSWKNEITDRLEGRSFISEFDVEISTNELVSQKDKERLDVEVSYLTHSASLSNEKSTSKKLRNLHIFKWHLRVEFFPLEQYK